MLHHGDISRKECPMTRFSLMSCLVLCAIGLAWSQEQSAKDIKTGINFIETKVYSDADNARILKLYDGLRVADVSDGMDMAGLPGVGLVDPAIHPDWVDRKTMSHQFRGIAVTVRYVPTQKPDRPESGQKFQEWEGNFYSKYSHEAFTKVIAPGTVVVIDDVEDKDIGSIGSYNILYWKSLGAVAVVTDATSRDTDEIEVEKVPLYLREKGRGIRPGRNEIESVNRPVVIGGVLVCPGDVVVGDGDGVIVVPRGKAEQVAGFAQEIIHKDKDARKALYKRVGLPSDRTVE